MTADLNSWTRRVPDLGAVFARFPVPIALMGIVTSIFMFIQRMHRYEYLDWLIAGLVAAAYMCVNIVLVREAHGKSRLVIVQVVLSAALAVMSWFAEDIRFLVPLFVGAGILFLGNTVRWKKGRDDLHTWDFTHKIWTGAIFATVGSIIYLLGILSIMAALKSLFGLNISKFMERVLLPVGFGFLAPLYWLSTIPDVDEDASELYENPSFISKAVAFLGTWILSPLTLIYALILIAYGLKIIIAGGLPKGEIAQLTTPFLIIGTATWLVLDPPFVREKLFAKLFRKSWFFLSVPAALLLAVAVGVRAGSYGLTFERIALLLCVIWSLGLAIWFIIGPKEKRDIRLIPGLAALLMAIAALTAQPLAFKSQEMRVHSNLKKAGVMTAEGIVKPVNDITITDKAAARKAKGALKFLVKSEEKSAIAKIFDGAENPVTNDGSSLQDLNERLGLIDISVNTGDDQKFQNYYNGNQSIAVSGYDTLSGPYWLYHNNKGNGTQGEGTDFTLSMDEDGLIIVSHRSQDITVFDFENWARNDVIAEDDNQIQNPMIQIFEAGDRRLALIVRDASFSSKPDSFRGEVMLLSAGFE